MSASENRTENQTEHQAEKPAEHRAVPFVVGAYPMLPPNDEDRHGAAALYAALADLGWVDGIELPFREALDAPTPWLAEQLAGRFTQCVVTAIPGTMGRAGADPSFAIGGVVRAMGTGAHLGGGSSLVAEADESDRSFLNYTPRVEIVTNVEPDHLDSYGTAEAFETAFVDFAHRLVPGGLLVACAADAGALRLAQSAAAEGLRVVTYSFAGPDTLPGGVLVGEGHVHLDIQERGASSTRGLLTLTTADGREPAGGTGEEPHHGPVELVLAVPGDHVALDAAGAWAAGIELGVDPALMARSLGAFGGTGRRFEDRGEADGVRVIDDYAHHPTEIARALEAGRGAAGGGRLIACFQPHLFSRTRIFAEEFGRALAAADLVVLTDVYPAREEPEPGVTGELVVDAARAAGADVRYVPDKTGLPAALADLVRGGDLVMTLGAGDITRVGPALLERLGASRS